MFTPLHVYKREQTLRRFRTHTIRLNAKELKNEYIRKEDDEKISQNIAKNFVNQGFSIHHNIVNALQKTSGNMSYKAIANQ